MNKEQAYDEHIFPLMERIIEHCMEHGIAMFCDFVIPTPEDPDLQCTTVLPDGEGKHPEHHRLYINNKLSTTNIAECNNISQVDGTVD